jgi:hypothetical protein
MRPIFGCKDDDLLSDDVDGYNPIYYPLGDLDKPTHRDIHPN